MALFNGIDIKRNDWTEVFSACLGQMIVIQSACADIVVKNSKWNIDFPKGVITFGKTDYPIQFIGSESEISKTWLWGWKNINRFDNKIISFANQIKKKGEEWKLAPFTIPEFDLNQTFNGHSLSIVSCAVSEEKTCYYRCVHNKGAIFVAFSGITEKVFEPVGIEKFASVSAQCIQQFYINHRIFIKSFLNWNKTPFDETENIITAHFPQDLFIEFQQTENGEHISAIRT